MLSDLDRQVLRIENMQWRYAGRKDAAIMGLGLNAETYGAALARLVRDPDAAVEYPLLVARLRRRLEKGLAQRRGRLSV